MWLFFCFSLLKAATFNKEVFTFQTLGFKWPFLDKLEGCFLGIPVTWRMPFTKPTRSFGWFLFAAEWWPDGVQNVRFPIKKKTTASKKISWLQNRFGMQNLAAPSQNLQPQNQSGFDWYQFERCFMGLCGAIDHTSHCYFSLSLSAPGAGHLGGMGGWPQSLEVGAGCCFKNFGPINHIKSTSRLVGGGFLKRCSIFLPRKLGKWSNLTI